MRILFWSNSSYGGKDGYSADEGVLAMIIGMVGYYLYPLLVIRFVVRDTVFYLFRLIGKPAPQRRYQH